MDLKSSSAELNHVLERLVALHRSLVDLLREEFAHMGTADVKGLAETARTKEVLLSEIWSLEQLRMKAVAKMAGSLNIPAGEASLQKLADTLNKADGEKLRALRTALNLLVVEAKDLNAKNMDFAQDSLARIEQLKRNVLGINSGASMENYSNNGARQPAQEQGGRLLSTEA